MCAPIAESDLPLDPDEFATRLVADIDAFIRENELGEPRFDRKLNESEMRDGLYTRVYNEIMAADVPRDMLDEAHRFEDPQIFVHLLKQIEDEAKHGRMLAQRLWNLGGDPTKTFEKASPSPLWDGFEELDIVEKTVTLQGAGERMAQVRHPNELKFYDDETAQIYDDVIVPEEKFHTMIGVNILRRCDDYDSQRTAIERWADVRDRLISHNEGGERTYVKSES